MMADTVQVHCPACNGAQALRDDGHYVCDFCLQPFSVAEARQEESRLLEEIQRWLQQKVGAGAAAGGIDAASRSYIFQQKILPDLRREVDRSLEILSGAGQFPLIQPPHAAGGQAAGNPLLARRREVLRLKAVRARLASDEVRAFAVTASEGEAIETLDRRLAEVMHLSNLTEAAATGRPEGYATSRRNLESLLEDLGRTLTGERDAGGGRPAYLGALMGRYRALAELCRVCEEASRPSPTDGAHLAAQVEALVPSLEEAAGTVEASRYSPAETMPVVLGIRQEAAVCRLLARWLRAYDALAGRGGRASFGDFAAAWKALGLASPAAGPETEADLLEAAVLAVRVSRGEVPARVVADFSWVDGWAEAQRVRKSLGLFGDEERVEAVERFLLPVWLAEVGFSQVQGKVFKAGVEGRCPAVVDACAPDFQKVVFLTAADGPLAQALAAEPRPAGAVLAGLPFSTEAAAQRAFLQAVQGRPGMLNAQPRPCGLAFLAAVQVRYVSRKGERRLLGCLGGTVPVDGRAPLQVIAAHQLAARLG